MDAVVADQATLNGAGPLFINEIMADNASTKADPQGDFDDWIEIYNASDRPVSLAGMYLTDDLSNPRKWRFPMESMARTMVLAHRSVLVWADGDTQAPGVHAGFALNAEGEEVGLADANGTLIDAVSFGSLAVDVSFGRLPDGGPGLQCLEYPTPGAGNSTAALSQVQDPLFSHHRGFYSSTFRLTIVCPTPGAQILYTLDGTDPEHPAIGASTAKVYTSPISIPALAGTMRTTCVRAVAVMDGRKPSRVITHTYVTNATAGIKSLPLISLVAESGQTFYGPNGVAANPMEHDLERPVSFEWIEPADNSGIQADCGLRVHGSDTWRPAWKPGNKYSWRLCFRREYGPGQLEYPVIPWAMQPFDSVVVRAGQNDSSNPFIKDELIRRLFRDMGHVSCCGTLANLVIDGQPKGYYNPTEHIDEAFCQKWFDSNQPWDVITMTGVRDGDRVRLDALISFVRQHNLADDAAYNQVLGQIDMEDFVDYLILRLWTGDWDWPQNNWAAASERSSEGKWRFFVWDAELSFLPTHLQTVYFTSLDSQANEHGYLWRALLASPRFRIWFGDRVHKHFFNGGALTAQNITKRFDELRGQMAGVLPSMDDYVTSTWVPQRSAIFLAACISEGVFTFPGPTPLINGKAQYGGYARAGDTLTLTTSEPDSRIYYTLDGIDPADRLTAGNLGRLNLVLRNSTKRALVPTRAVDSTWRGPGTFDDSTWMKTGGGVGFGGTGSYASSYTLNVSTAMKGINASCLVRIPFSSATSLQDIASLTLKIQHDCAFVAYLNGVEVARRNFTGEPAWNSHGTVENSDAVAVGFRSFDILSFVGSLHQGQNILAIHAMNSLASDQDFLINAELIADVKPSVSVPAGLTFYSGPVHLDRTVTVRARAVTTDLLSSLSQATFAVGPVAKGIRISEVMYHGREGGDPADPNTEYVELVNAGSQTVNLSQVRLTGGVEFTFPAVDLTPGQFVLVVGDAAAFVSQYGGACLVAGQYTGDLSNKGGQIRLLDAAGGLIEQFQYADAWHPIADGRGFSLTAVDPAADPNLLSTRPGWRPSAAIGGAPGWDDAGQVPALGSVVVSEVMANVTTGQSDWIELHNTTSQPVDIGGWFLSDSKEDLTKYRISQGTTLSPGGTIVFYEDRQFGNPSEPGCASPFGLSAAGEAVYLTSGAAGRPTGFSDVLSFGSSEPGVSLGRWVDVDGEALGVALTSATAGQANAQAVVGPVVISEVFANPDTMPEAEFIELVNRGSQTVTLYDSQSSRPWRLIVEVGDSRSVVLDLPTSPALSLGPGDCAMLVKSRPLFELRFTGLGSGLSVVQWNQGNLPDTAATVRLLRPAQIPDAKVEWVDADAMSYGTTTAGKSWQRSPASGLGLDPCSWRLAVSTSPGTYSP